MQSTSPDIIAASGAGAEILLFILIAPILIGYFIGSIPFGLILSKLAGYGDIRKIGSHNIGATNVLRTGNKKLAAATLLGDMAKGALPVFLVWPFAGLYGGLLAGISAFLGHLYPVWLKFRGGKGVATYIGVQFGWLWPVGLGFCLIWLASAYLTRFSSLSALIASALSPILFYIWGSNYMALGALFISLLIFIAHRENISRLLAGEETKIGQKE